MRRWSCIHWWNLRILSMDANWFDTKLIKLQPVEGKSVGLSFALMGRWCAKLMRVIVFLILLESLMLVINLKKKRLKALLKGMSVLCNHLLLDFVYSMNSSIQWTHLICNSFVTWIHLLHEFPFFLYKILHGFTHVCLYELLDVDTMATKEAKSVWKLAKIRNASCCKLLWNQLLVKLYHIEHHHSNWNVQCKLWCLLATTIFSTFWPKVISIIHIIHVWNQKPFFGASVILNLVKLFFWHFYQMLMSHQLRLPK